MDIRSIKYLLLLLIIVILQQSISNAMQPKRSKAYKQVGIHNNIILDDVLSKTDELRYMGAALSISNVFIIQLNKFLIALNQLQKFVSNTQKEKSLPKKVSISSHKLIKSPSISKLEALNNKTVLIPNSSNVKSKAVLHQEYSSEEEGEDYYENNYTEEHSRKKRNEEEMANIRMKLYKSLLKFGEELVAYHSKLKVIETGELYYHSIIHLSSHNNNQNHYIQNSSAMQSRRKKRNVSKVRTLSMEAVRSAMKNEDPPSKKEVLFHLEALIQGVEDIIRMLTAYKEGMPSSYSHCNQDDFCISKISDHLKGFANKTNLLDEELLSLLKKEPELQVITPEEIKNEFEVALSRVEAFLAGVSVKDEIKVNIDSDALWKVFALDFYRLGMQESQELEAKNLAQLESALSMELNKALKYQFKFPEYVENSRKWKSEFLHYIFQLERKKEILKARWHEINAFLSEKNHSNHSFKNDMYYKGKLPNGMEVDDSGAAVYLIIENALQYMNVLNECVSIDAATKTLRLDWDKMARMGPFGQFAKAKLIEHQVSNNNYETPVLNQRLRGIEKLLSAAKEVLFQLNSKQTHSPYWTGLIMETYKQLHVVALAVEKKMEKLLGIHQQAEELRKGADMDVDSNGVYKKTSKVKNQFWTLNSAMLHLRNILSAPILDVVV